MKPPKNLGSAGKAVWESIASKYELRADEVLRLEGACLTADMIATLEQAWADAGKPWETKGSMGQQVIHPLVGEIRTQRAALERSLIALKLPDDGDAPAVNQNRDAAQSSWAPGVRRGA